MSAMLHKHDDDDDDAYDDDDDDDGDDVKHAAEAIQRCRHGGACRSGHR
mgnify:CR=1 FL=1